MLDNLKISPRPKHKGNKSHKPEPKAGSPYLFDWTKISIGQKPRANRELKQPGTTTLTRTREFAYYHVHFHIFVHFTHVLVQSTTRNDLFCNCVCLDEVITP